MITDEQRKAIHAEQAALARKRREAALGRTQRQEIVTAIAGHLHARATAAHVPDTEAPAWADSLKAAEAMLPVVLPRAQELHADEVAAKRKPIWPDLVKAACEQLDREAAPASPEAPANVVPLDGRKRRKTDPEPTAETSEQI